MALDFRNLNTLWASVLAETLARLGLQTVVICPGSRSAPLAIAFAQHPDLEAIPVLDERSAAFFALGVARRSNIPVALICTSGTAGANFYPAIIEAKESRVPLLVLTADRPPELRHCHAGQATTQTNLYGGFPNWQAELAMPAADQQQLAYLRQTAMYSWERTQFPVPGPVHLNIPLREPLAPTAGQIEGGEHLDEAQFFSSVQWRPAGVSRSTAIPPEWLGCEKGIIVAGPAIPPCAETYCRAVGKLSQSLGWPILAEGLSPLRNYSHFNPYLISTYGIALCSKTLAERLKPSQVVRLGELPTNKALRTWLQALTVPQWIIEPSDQNVDPLHGVGVHLRTRVEELMVERDPIPSPSAFLQQWLQVESNLRQAITETFQHTDAMIECKAAWLLSQVLPARIPLFVSNSMPVRDIEQFWQPGQNEIQLYFNRGVNGIDGILSSALGVVHHRQGVLLTGDLALLHDTNGFLMRPHWQGHLTIVLINNKGGGIFETLPIAHFDPPFETFFATPQQADFTVLCAAYGVEHVVIQSWEDLARRLNPLPNAGIRVLELRCNRKADAPWRQDLLHRLSTENDEDSHL